MSPLTFSPLIQLLNYLDANSEERVHSELLRTDCEEFPKKTRNNSGEIQWNIAANTINTDNKTVRAGKTKAIKNTKETMSSRERRRQRREADVTENIHHYDVQSCPLSTNGGCCSSVPSWSRRCQNLVSTNEQFSGSLDRKSIILKSNKVKKQSDRT
ncbi:uncharacterized protein V6R79_023923 [Siganus canaliculatus]